MATKPAAKRSYKLDLMTVLEAADRGRRDFYTNLTEEERKAFAPRVLIRWLSTLNDTNSNQTYAILAVNDLINLGLWSLGKHPELVWLLMTVAGTGKKQYHSWIPTRKSAGSTPRLDALIGAIWPHSNSMEQSILKNNHTAAQWLELAAGSGISDRELKELRDELKKQQKTTGD